MTYEWAKALKDAGFPPHDYDYCNVGGCWKDCHRPALSELIEACGDKFFGLYKTVNGWLAEEFVVGERSRHTSGSTPEEAVAKLWLKLNKPS